MTARGLGWRIEAVQADRVVARPDWGSAVHAPTIEVQLTPAGSATDIRIIGSDSEALPLNRESLIAELDRARTAIQKSVEATTRPIGGSWPDDDPDSRVPSSPDAWAPSSPAPEPESGHARRAVLILVSIFGAALITAFVTGGLEAGIDGLSDSDFVSSALALLTIALAAMVIIGFVVGVSLPITSKTREILVLGSTLLFWAVPVAGGLWALSAPEIYTPVARWLESSDQGAGNAGQGVGGGGGGDEFADCQGYDPCIQPGSDVDCQGGTGDGPRYIGGPVSVNGGDPYGLDGYDQDGVGCEYP